jgi:hypothetical protein
MVMPYLVSLISLGNRAKFLVASHGGLGERTNILHKSAANWESPGRH